MLPDFGLSPRVRGKPASAQTTRDKGRSIPACAGETGRHGRCGVGPAVYPRVCGGNLACLRAALDTVGLSPRVRGKHLWRIYYPLDARSIPACAGETIECRDTAGHSRVYPRVCGGNQMLERVTAAPRGLSPRVRGKPHLVPTPVDIERSIPACAGETVPRAYVSSVGEVYPRVCGGNHLVVPIGQLIVGLSPRVRGKLWAILSRSYHLRSIPACAGETPAAPAGRRRSAVYPRVCGGNAKFFRKAVTLWGLSPRVRGKLTITSHAGICRWSIPACAGETVMRWKLERFGEVYPRVCGGNRRPHHRILA